MDCSIRLRVGLVCPARTSFLAVQDLLQSPEIFRGDVEEFAPDPFPGLAFVLFAA